MFSSGCGVVYRVRRVGYCFLQVWCGVIRLLACGFLYRDRGKVEETSTPPRSEGSKAANLSCRLLFFCCYYISRLCQNRVSVGCYVGVLCGVLRLYMLILCTNPQIGLMPFVSCCGFL